MSWLIDKVRSWFCKHEWELLQKTNVYKRDNIQSGIPSGFEWVYVCKKCMKRKIIKW